MFFFYHMTKQHSKILGLLQKLLILCPLHTTFLRNRMPHNRHCLLAGCSVNDEVFYSFKISKTSYLRDIKISTRWVHRFVLYNKESFRLNKLYMIYTITIRYVKLLAFCYLLLRQHN